MFIQAGQEDFEEKTFHYLSNSLFDDEPQQMTSMTPTSSAAASPPIVNADEEPLASSLSTSYQKPDEQDSVARSRNKYGIVDENYGLVRFGAVFMDSLVKRPPEADDHSAVDVKSSSSNLNSTFMILYGIQINLSANLLHR